MNAFQFKWGQRCLNGVRWLTRSCCVERLFHDSSQMSQPRPLEPRRESLGCSKRRNPHHINTLAFHHLSRNISDLLKLCASLAGGALSAHIVLNWKDGEERKESLENLVAAEKICPTSPPRKTH